MPLRWQELGRTRGGSAYDLQRALRRAARLKGDPWEGWEEAARQSLPGPGGAGQGAEVPGTPHWPG